MTKDIAVRNVAMGLLVVLALAVSASADEPAERSQLDRRIGEWRTTTTLKKAAWTNEEVTVAGEETIKWILGEKVQQGEAKDENGLENHWLMTYDPEAKVYRFWYFDSAGAFPRGEAVGRAKGDDELAWTMDLGNGVRAESTWKFTGNDRLDWELVARDPEKTVVLHMVAYCVRKK